MQSLTIAMHGRSLSDCSPSHPYNARSEHVGFAPSRQTLLAPSAKRHGVFGESNKGEMHLIEKEGGGLTARVDRCWDRVAGVVLECSSLACGKVSRARSNLQKASTSRFPVSVSLIQPVNLCRNHIKSNRTEPNRTVPNRTELHRTEPNRTEPNRTEPNRTEPNRTEPNRTKKNEPTAPNRSCENTSIPWYV